MNASFDWADRGGSAINVDAHDYEGARPPGVCLSVQTGVMRNGTMQMEWVTLHLKSFDEIERLGQEVSQKAREAKAELLARKTPAKV